jgi:uncharacterized protein (TIGR02145 family)
MKNSLFLISKKASVIRIFTFLLFGMFALLTTNCKKDNSSSGNPYNGRTTAVFNPNLTYGTLTDQDGNIYKTIKIGNQTWMAENLRTTKYIDGSDIPNVTSDTAWRALTKGAYCTYNNTTDLDTISTYGMLYNWFAVCYSRIAPTGWHVPNDSDWLILASNLGPIRDDNAQRIEGGRLKEIDTLHWHSPNRYANNSTGFTGLPGGGRFVFDSFWGIGVEGRWWSTSYFSGDVRITVLGHHYGGISLDAVNLTQGIFGFSVRCVKDN